MKNLMSPLIRTARQTQGRAARLTDLPCPGAARAQGARGHQDRHVNRGSHAGGRAGAARGQEQGGQGWAVSGWAGARFAGAGSPAAAAATAMPGAALPGARRSRAAFRAGRRGTSPPPLCLSHPGALPPLPPPREQVRLGAHCAADGLPRHPDGPSGPLLLSCARHGALLGRLCGCGLQPKQATLCFSAKKAVNFEGRRLTTR